MSEIFVALVPLAIIGSVIWFAVEVISSLHRIEAAVREQSSINPEFTYVS